MKGNTEMRSYSRKITGNTEIAAKYGTINKKDPRVIYLEGKTWLLPDSLDDYNVRVESVKNNFAKLINCFTKENTDIFFIKHIFDFECTSAKGKQSKKKFLSFDIFFKQKKDIPLPLANPLFVNGFTELINNLEKTVLMYGFKPSKHR